MSNKTKPRTPAQNTSAPATPEKSADVLEKEAAPAVSPSAAPTSFEGETSGEAQALPPLGELPASTEPADLTNAAPAEPVADTGQGEPIGDTDPADPEAAAQPEVAATHEIKAIPAKGFCRAGRRWPTEATRVNRADFSDEQWQSLTDEANLIVRPL